MLHLIDCQHCSLRASRLHHNVNNKARTVDEVSVLVVVDVRVSGDAVLEADVQVVPDTTVQHHIPHHPDPVFNLRGGKEKQKSKRDFSFHTPRLGMFAVHTQHVWQRDLQSQKISIWRHPTIHHAISEECFDSFLRHHWSNPKAQFTT